MVRVHHLNCCTMCPRGGRLMGERGTMVSHCLLVETDDDGLVLVDTGLGTADLADPGRLGGFFRTVFRPQLRPTETAVRQVVELGFAAEDVRHIVVTHLDVDHAGGLADFPDATVHVHADEHAAAVARRTQNERGRYRTAQWAHAPNWKTYRADGEAWFGFEATRTLPGLPDDIVAIPLPGHTRGHTAIAVRTADGWLLHAGDAYFNHGSVTGPDGQVPPLLRVFERGVAIHRRQVQANHDRLRALAHDHADEVRMFCAHDPEELETFGSPRRPGLATADDET
ncbi:MAG TPA: MBL fold metallo-hydrolase [Cryptosporangiaceae bacterium]|nr:MBL fold metallo-hydrolase [Cryptosporangiaceae bacterium]